MAATREFLLQQYYHVALPRDVPGKEDRNLCQVEAALLDRIVDAVKTITPFVPLEHQSFVDAIRLTLVTSKALNVDGKVDKTLLAKELNELSGKHALILYVTEQNAALLVYKDTDTCGDDLLVFEAFETSATCEKVLASENALQWGFPGRAVSVSSKVHRMQSFQECVAAFVEQASIESVKQFAAVTYKAAAPLPEIRDTTDPTLMSDFFMTVLEANGTKHDVPVLRKRVRDTVSFNEARKPWRRSPFYLVIRVAIQRHLYKILGPEIGRLYYKIILAIFLSRLLGDIYDSIPHEASFFLMQKLGRRLAKIEEDKSSLPETVQVVHDFVLSKIRDRFRKSLGQAKGFLEYQWDLFRARNRRAIRPLPQYVGRPDLTLQLPFSGSMLNLIAFGGPMALPTQLLSPIQLLKQYESSGAKAKPFAAIADRYLHLAGAVEEVMHANTEALKDTEWDRGCCTLARTIKQYISTVGNAFDGYPEFMSGLILDLMELWVEMDRHATASIPLLNSYHPGFDANMLDCLELLQLDDMKRAGDVQRYLSRRCRGWSGSGSKTIFDTPAGDSFAVVYYDMFGESAGLKQLRRKIEAEAEIAREAKEQEWRRLSHGHEQLMQKVAESTCPYVTVVAADGTVSREHQRGCPKHRYKWQAKQIKIKIFEHPLPDHEPAAKAALFELRCPESFAAYRDATWLLLAALGHPQVNRCENVPTLRGYSQVTHHASSVKTHVTLGSRTKSHLECHYAESGFPVALHLVCRPCGLKLDYYDTLSQSWTSRPGLPSFNRHCPLMLPNGSPYHYLRINNDEWPSSNDIIANQTRCPPDLNVHEFMAWQGLLGVTHCRWLSFLRELGATNLNFSTESTWTVVSKLVLQMGPSSLDNTLRDIHAVFDDETFCKKLLEQVSHRLEAIQRNWREPIQMDILISILLKTISLSSYANIKNRASKLLDQARIATWGWCITLQSSTMTTSEESTMFTIWASVLCKRTVQRHGDSIRQLESASLQCFIGASIILQENLVGQFKDMPFGLRSLVLQDLLYTFRNRKTLAALVPMSHEALLSALNHVWPLPPNYTDGSPTIRLVPHTLWVEMPIKARERQFMHVVHYHLVRGDLLIDGKQSGILPAEYHHPTIEMLFGTHALRVRPSYQPGMSLFIAHPRPYRHWIHLGFRQGQLVVRAVQDYTTLELIDRRIFGGGSQYDLPLALIANCYHWLNVDSKSLEIRQDDIWKSKPGNWKLDLCTRHATKKNSTLVDPCSLVARTVAKNFQYFEYAHHITVIQPVKGPLSVELKRLELSFFVNHMQLLQCRELGAEIVWSNHQDAGVWYGLHSKIVLRSIKNPRQRMILVPEGRIRVHRNEQHVTILVENSGSYLRFDIDDVLGRILCPAEHRLLYTKALWHAYTSFVLPDPLTGRTGSEEALYLLRTGLYKPWKPLHETVSAILISIADLSPNRVYYPTSMKCMETVHWKHNLTNTIQDDRYRAVVEQICERSAQLQLFETNPTGDNPDPCPPGDPHLEARSIARSGGMDSRDDQLYLSRDRPTNSTEQINVALVTKLFSEWTVSIANTKCLAQLLQDYPVIGGMNEPFDRVQIFDRISVKLGEDWGALVQTAIQSGPDDRYRLMFVFAPMALSQYTSIDLLHVLVSYAILADLKDIKHPSWPSYLRFRSDEVPAVKDLAELMKDAHQPYAPPPLGKGERPGQMALARIKHEEACHHNCLELAKAVRSQWPHVDVDLSKLPSIDQKLLDTDTALEPVLGEWRRLAQNHEFSKYLEEVQIVLDHHSATVDFPTNTDDVICNGLPTCESPTQYPLRVSGRIPTIQDLLRKSIMFENASSQRNPVTIGLTAQSTEVLKQLPNGHLPSTQKGKDRHPDDLQKRPNSMPHLQELSDIVRCLEQSGSSVQQKYGFELQQSIDALGLRTAQPSLALQAFDAIASQQDILKATDSCNEMLQDISQALEQNNSRVTWLKLGALWPKMSKTALLSELRSTANTIFGEGTKEALVELGIQITSLQRLLRMQDSARKGKKEQLREERLNQGHANWDPLVKSDWLLLEIDSNMMLRAEQVEVANVTIAPASRCNSVVQLLMGKGKTSCILPMVAAVLADKRSLLRIMVPRALLLQSAQVMQIKLGGLLDREVLHIPFSRRTKANKLLLHTFGQLHSNLKKSSGVLLSLPENVLSFKLSGLQRLCEEKLEEGKAMINMQGWLDRNARDVLDECDISLAIRTQLIYPSGSQMAVDGHPLRWQTVQAVLRLLRQYIPELERLFPRSIEIVHRVAGDFPLIYLLRRDVENYIISLMVDDICKGQLASLPCAEIPVSAQEDIRAFISSPTVTSQVIRNVNSIFRDKQHLMKILYLLRGLFVHRILLSTLKKRWNVQYGLHPTRDPIAVPYHAKGVPSPTSEWGHPDVAIILTCLSFYYQGVDLAQFKQAFEQLLKSDEPSIEYEKWATKSLPGYLRDYNAINVEDGSQLRELHQHIRFNVYLLDFYLNNFVFPKHAKQFDTKLQASGWDLVLFDPALKSNCKTTGFSGTNDSRHQLPMMIKQNDLPELAHTNAEVLSYLLQERNRRYVRIIDDSGRRLSEEGLLEKLLDPIGRSNAKDRIRILIDAGAQILEHDNYSLARAWLNVDWTATAAVFFDSDHRPWVLYRKGKRVPLLASPFAENLEGCVVYLDESHCRGTDLKLPPNARAALTLGPHVTKDALAQAAMRLRLLGQSQAVTFFSPPEVHQSILDLRKKSEAHQVNSSDVIAWLLEQSCNGIEQLEPLYFNQGNTFMQHQQARIDNQAYLTNVHQRSRYLSIVQTKESQTLKQLYEPKQLRKGNGSQTIPLKGQLGAFATELEHRKKRFQDRGIATHSSALEEVEQEREIEYEVEEVRELEKPVHYAALRIPRLHKDILEFAKSGKIVAASEAYQPMFSALQRTASGKKHGAFSVTSGKYSGLFVSTQFVRTVKLVRPNDDFIRPCQWILWSTATSMALIVSPEEADALLPLLRRYRHGKEVSTGYTHMIVYSAPVTRRMLHFNNLDYHATPPLPSRFKVPIWLKIELGIFSGRLYFEWHEYKELLAYLGVKMSAEQEEDLDSVSSEAFVKKPLSFLHDWLAVLRKGQDFEHTPMGFVTTGKPLSADHPFFLVNASDEPNQEAKPGVSLGGHRREVEHDSDSDDDDEDEYHHEDDRHRGDVEDHEEGKFEEDDNAFFDAAEYNESDEDEDEDEDGSASDDSGSEEK